MRKFSFTIILFALFGCGPLPQTVPSTTINTEIQVPKSTSSSTVQFLSVANGLTKETALQTYARGFLCVTFKRKTYEEGALKNIDLKESFRIRFSAIVEKELKAAGYQTIASNETPSQNTSGNGADYYLAAKVIEVKRHLCHYSQKERKGKLYYKVEWSLLNAKSEEIAFKGSTEGASELTEPTEDGSNVLRDLAISVVTRNLLATEAFTKQFK